MSYELTHHGIKGMKWGVRRYQNKDGSLTEEGKKRLDAQKSYDTQTAIGLLSQQKRYQEVSYKKNVKERDKYEQKANKYAMKAAAAKMAGNSNKEKKNVAKVQKLIERSVLAGHRATVDMYNRGVYDRKIKEIDSGKLEVGKDFVIDRVTLTDGATFYYSSVDLKLISEKALEGSQLMTYKKMKKG